jgi:myo-inositol-1(or 4)-monophosphatase
MRTVKFFMENSHGLRRLGSAATDIAYVACGRFEGFYEYGLNPWDVAAGVIILKQAGGKVSDFKGGRNYLFGGEIIATNTNIYDEFLAVINKLMVSKD